MKKGSILFILLCLLFSCKKKEILRESNISDTYIEANRGKSFVEIPLVYEISNIIMVLEDRGMSQSTFINQRSTYHQEVIDYFSPYKEHKLIKKLDLSTNNGLSPSYFNDHYSFRTNSYAYKLEGETIVDKQIYGTLQRNDKFTEYLEDIQDFIIESNLLDFLEAHADFYQQEIENYKKVIPIQKEWDWLEDKFPQRVDTYKVIFSPLTYASHNTKKIKKEAASYTEILMFISGLPSAPTELSEVKKAYNERVVFTEIDHNYVNPESDKNLATIKESMKNLSEWYTGNNYDGAYQIFNEYMTWAVFTLYLKEHYATADYLEAKKGIESQMEKSRKFLRFSAFNDKLLELYEKDSSDVAALYPAILDWVNLTDKN